MNFKPVLTRLIPISLSAALSLTATGAFAEDGTSGSLPEGAHQCEVVVANWTPGAAAPEVSPEASPAATLDATPLASPVASPMASPAASPVLEEETSPVAEEDEALIEDLEAATHAILDCMSDNNLEVLLNITGEHFRGSWLGLGTNVTDEDFSVFLPMMPNLPYALVDISNASADGDTASATVRFTTGRQLITSEWTYQLADVNGQNAWVVQQEVILPTKAPEGAAHIQVVINDGSFEFNTTSVESGDIVLDVTNVGSAPHEMLIVRAPAGTDAGDFAAAPTGIPSGSTYVGQVTVPAGTQGSIVLTDVRSGSYTVVDLLPDASGMPNVSNGMIIEFTVEDE